MQHTRFLLPFVFAFLGFFGCATQGNQQLASKVSISNAEDLVSYLGRHGYFLRQEQLTVPNSLADVGYEYSFDGGRIRIYEFKNSQDAERAVDEFVLDNSGIGTGSVFHSGILLVATSSGNSSLELSLSNSLGPAIY